MQTVEEKERCHLIRSSITTRIDDLNERMKMSMTALNEKTNLTLDSHTKIITESMSNINSIVLEHKDAIKSIVDKIDDLKCDEANKSIMCNRVKDDIKYINKRLDDHEVLLKNISEIKGMIVSNRVLSDSMLSEIDEVKNDIIILSEDLKEEISLTTAKLVSMPKIISMYEAYIKYKYLIMGAALILLITSGTGGATIMTTIIHLIGF